MARLGISYSRVSSARQTGEDRDGIARQQALFDDFCRRHNLHPAPERILDAGISAFRGKHRRRGGLGQLLDAAQAGAVPPGSVIVIEDLDRFSRESPADALRALLNGVFGSGLAIGVCRFDAVISEADFNDSVGSAVQLQLAIGSAHEFSAKLAGRVASAWRRRADAAEQGQKLPDIRPWWVDYDPPTGSFTLNEHAAIARRMVRLSLDGVGATRIAATLNREGITTLSRFAGRGGRPWSQSLIQRVLQSRALIGEACIRLRGQPDRILPAYFPPLISSAEFDLVRQGIASRNDRKGRVGRGVRVHNILQGVVHCPCGRPLAFTGRVRKGVPYHYLRCPGRLNAMCDRVKCWRYDEEALLQALSRQRWDAFFSRGSDSHQRRDLQHRILEAEAEEARARGQADRARANLTELLRQGALTPAVASTLGQAADDAQQQADQLSQGLSKLRAELRALDAKPTGEEAEQQLLERVAAFIAHGRHDPHQRQRFNAWLQAQGIHITLHHQDRQQPLLVLRLRDGTDTIELHQVTSDGDALHVRARPDALSQLWHDHGQRVTLPDGSEVLALDGGAGQPG